MKAWKFVSVTMLAATGIALAQAPHAAGHHTGTPDPPTIHYYGAVDLGSKGTKASLYSFETEDEGRNPVVIFSKTINTSLVSSMQGDKFTADGIADATQAVRTVVDAMKAEAAKRRVDVDAFYVAGSSGVARASNKQDLADSVKAATGITMVFVDAPREGYYGLWSAVPRSRRSTSIYIDIGSGNAKVGCLVGGTDFASYKSDEIPWGSVSGRNEALKRDPNDIVAGVASVMQDVTAQYEAKSRDVPCLRNRDRIYWTGGAAWATATFTHPEREMNGWVTISRRDLERFLTALRNGTWNQRHLVFNFPPDMPAARQNEIRAKAEKEWEDVQNVFVREDLLSGVSIMEAVLNSSNPSASIHFVRSGNFIYGYALDIYKEDSAGQ
jgi:exopolyphosphatase/pppGpp-phosphohydrolase